jgi:hypothetical protein
MTNPGAALPVNEAAAGQARLPYPPSWFDRVEARIDALPGHFLMYYVAFGALIGVLSVLGAGGQADSLGPFSPVTRIFGAFLIAYLLGAAHYLDRTAVAALEKIKPRLELDPGEYSQLRYRLTTLPARKALLVSLGWILLLALSLLFYPEVIGFDLDLRNPLHVAFILQGVVVWWLLGLGAYHTIHQLREVSRAHEKFLHVNLYYPDDLYALSSMSAISSIAVIAPVTIALVVMPQYILQPMGLAFIVLCGLIAGITLAWPIWNVHQAMVKEKARIQAACSARYEALLGEWHARIDQRQLDGNSDLQAAINGLADEKEEIKKIPTWPWSPGIVRGWIASLVLPLAIWVVQVILEYFVFGN